MNQLFTLLSSVVLQSAGGTQTIKAKTTGRKKKTTSHQHNPTNKKNIKTAAIVEMKLIPCTIAECGLDFHHICFTESEKNK